MPFGKKKETFEFREELLGDAPVKQQGRKKWGRTGKKKASSSSSAAAADTRPILDSIRGVAQLRGAAVPLNHPNNGSQRVIPCVVTNVYSRNDVRLVTCPRMRCAEDVCALDVVLGNVPQGRRVLGERNTAVGEHGKTVPDAVQELIKMLGEAPMHLVSFGPKECKKNIRATVWPWYGYVDSSTPVPDTNPPSAESINARMHQVFGVKRSEKSQPKSSQSKSSFPDDKDDAAEVI